MIRKEKTNGVFNNFIFNSSCTTINAKVSITNNIEQKKEYHSVFMVLKDIRKYHR